MEKHLNFVAIDFEWVSNDKDACAVGMVKVVNGVIAGKFYSLIKPKTDEWNPYCCDRHGITPEMVKDAPTFAELEPTMEVFAGGLLHVGHNYDEAEKHVFIRHAREGSSLKGVEFVDTMKGNKLELTERCAEYGIPLEEHHDALEDAMATALLYMKLQGEEVVKPKPSEKPKSKMQGSKRDGSLNYMVEADKVPYKDTPFMGVKFVVSGFPDSIRDKIIVLLRDNFGGLNHDRIMGDVKILVGHSKKCGPKKLKDAEKLGCKIYNEMTLLEEVVKPNGLQKEWEEIFLPKPLQE